MTWRYGSTRWQLEGGGGHENTSEKAFQISGEGAREGRKKEEEEQATASGTLRRIETDCGYCFCSSKLRNMAYCSLQRLRHSLMRQAVAVGVFLLFQYYLNRNGAVVAGVTCQKRRAVV